MLNKRGELYPPSLLLLSVLSWLKERILYHFCGKEDDEDHDDQHNHTDYNHQFNVFPPVFPGDPCGCSLERVSLKRNGQETPMKHQS